MRRKPEIIVPLVLLAVVLGPDQPTAQEPPVATDIPARLIQSYAEWATALENASPAAAVWHFPFGAPKPSDLTAEELQIVLSLRRVVLNGSPVERESLADQVARRQQTMPAQMAFWLAYIQGQVGQREACLSNLEALLMDPQAWSALEKGQQAWVLTETADLLFLLERRASAAACYTRLSVSPLDQLRTWGHYQLAGLAFLDRDFAQATQHYQTVCEGDKPATWRGHACAMASIAHRLTRLQKEEGFHGLVAASGP